MTKRNSRERRILKTLPPVVKIRTFEQFLKVELEKIRQQKKGGSLF